MNKTSLSALLCVFASGLSSVAFAEQPYVGVDYQVARVKSTEASVDLDSVLLRAGTTFDQYWGFEAQVSFGIKKDSFKGTDGNTYQVKTNGQYAAFFKPQLSLDKNISLYGLIGANYADITQEAPDGTKAGNFGTSFAAGAGFNVFLNQHFGVGVEYVHYDKDIDAMNLGLRYRF